MDINSPIFQRLKSLARDVQQQKLESLFNQNPNRAQEYSIECGPIYFDFSKNFLNQEILSCLLELSRERKLESKIDDCFTGKLVNITEQRAAHHTALRENPNNRSEQISSELTKIKHISQMIRNKAWFGFSGKPITDVVHIGIGGSYLGPAMVCTALKSFHGNINIHFVANIDNADIVETLQVLNPETTIFIIASKTFTTQETLINAAAAKNWLLQNNCTVQDLNKHFIAISNNAQASLRFGISNENILIIWDWIGGRYSVWSAIGLPIAIAIGYDNFEKFLAGAHLIDKHCHSQPLEKNIPILLGLIGVWYQAFFSAHTQAIIPYAHQLRLLVNYIQQLDMESNGKTFSPSQKQMVNYHTSPIVWGGVGTNAQHSFHQLLHQGDRFIPVDFILPLSPSYQQYNDQHKFLVANCLAQAQALMVGKENLQQLHLHMPGNKPSNLITIEKLTPYALGALIAMYEHKTLVQAIIWDINPFDQFGVSLGKKISDKIYQTLNKKQNNENHDQSTKQLIKKYFEQQEISA